MTSTKNPTTNPRGARPDTADGSDRRPELTPNHTPDSIQDREKAAGSSGGHVK